MESAIVERQPDVTEDEEIQGHAIEPTQETTIVEPPANWGIVPQSFSDFMSLAEVIQKSGLAPKDLNTREQVFCALQMGAEIGLTPMQSVQSIAVINGRPTVWGDAALGLVQASGLLTSFHETPLYDDKKEFLGYHCAASRRGLPGITEHIFTMADAKLAGLLGKKSPWQTMPRRMCQMRARGFVLRDLFADRLKGIYLSEEIQGGEDFIDVTPGPRPPIEQPRARTEPSGPPPVPPWPEDADQPNDSRATTEPSQEGSSGNVEVGIVESISRKATKKNDRLGIKLNAKWYNTFSETFGKLAEDSKEFQKPISLEWKETQYGLDVVNMEEFGG